jgi:hypothetical protein
MMLTAHAMPSPAHLTGRLSGHWPHLSAGSLATAAALSESDRPTSSSTVPLKRATPLQAGQSAHPTLQLPSLAHLVKPIGHVVMVGQLLVVTLVVLASPVVALVVVPGGVGGEVQAAEKGQRAVTS